VRRDERWIDEQSQVDEEHTVGELRHELTGDLQREPCLSDPADARERHEP
jgi:hypothetical protein